MLYSQRHPLQLLLCPTFLHMRFTHLFAYIVLLTTVATVGAQSDPPTESLAPSVSATPQPSMVESPSASATVVATPTPSASRVHKNTTMSESTLDEHGNIIKFTPRVLLLCAMALFYGIAVVGTLLIVALRSRLEGVLLFIFMSLNITVMSLLIGVAYMYTAEEQFFYIRGNVVVVTPILILNFLLWLDIVMVGGLFLRLHQHIRNLTSILTMIGMGLITLASFSDNSVQWPGYCVGAALMSIVPLLWLLFQERQVQKWWERHTCIWLTATLVLKILYTAAQLAGHSFARKLAVSDELVFNMVNHVLTLVLLCYAAKKVLAPKQRTRANVAESGPPMDKVNQLLSSNGGAMHRRTKTLDASGSAVLMDSTLENGGGL